nr:glycosyltransferase family 39 protein [Actinomycetota bacterium]
MTKLEPRASWVVPGLGDVAENAESVSPSSERPLAPIDVVALLGLVVLLAFLWGRGRHVWFWLDEGISVGISSHRLTMIPELLRQDGSPPLYYLLLHGWMSVLGTSEAATHVLSLLFALATVPTALWAGWSLFGRRAGWMAATLVAISPFLGSYANETRMYTLVALLGLVATATFLHAFVYRRRRHLSAFAVSLTLLLYTHNWALFLTLGAGIALLGCIVLAPREARGRILFDGILAFGGAAVMYAPWVPTLAYQLAHTGAPFT